MNASDGGVLDKAVSGGRWSLAGLVLQKTIGLGSFFILARLLTPADYGVITIVLMLVGVLETLSMPGFASALIQKKGEIKEYLDVFWTLNLLRAFFIFLLIFLAAPLVGRFFHITGSLAIAVLRFSGLIILLQAAGNLGNLFFFKELDFKKVFIRDMGGQIAFVTAAVLWALFHPTVLALFLGYLAQNLASVLVQYWLHPHRPRFSFYFKRLRDLASYGAWAMGQNILNQANSIVETAVIGRLLGARDLGFYSRANSIASLPSSAIFSVIYKVGFPAYAKIQESREKITEGFLKSWDLALLTLLPFLVFIFFEAGELVPILLGERWLGMVGAMRILVFALTFEGFSHLAWPLLEGIGRPDLRFKFGFLQFALALPLLIILSWSFGLLGAASAMVIAFFIVVLAAGWTLFKHLRPEAGKVLKPAALVFLAVFASAFLGGVLRLWLLPFSVPTFILWSLAVGLLYLAALRFLSKFFGGGPYETLRLIFKF